MSVPDPLTPAECDLRGLPFMPMDVVRVMDSDLFALSTGDEFKAALALWCKAWLQVPAASLPDDDRVLAHLSGAGAKWKKVKEGALRNWIKCADGRLYHPVVAEKAAEAWKHRLAQRERANKRWGNADNGSSGNATACATEDATAHATAMQGRGTGTVKGKAEPSPTESTKPLKPEPRTHVHEEPIPDLDDARLAYEYVCRASDWRAANDTQRQNGISIINGWLALGCRLPMIVEAIVRARKRDPSPTRSLKRFDSTIRGMRGDELGGELPVTAADIGALTNGAAKRLSVST